MCKYNELEFKKLNRLKTKAVIATSNTCLYVCNLPSDFLRSFLAVGVTRPLLLIPFPDLARNSSE